MTTLTAATPVASTQQRLRSVLRADAVVTGAVGAVTLLAATPLADLMGTPTVLALAWVLGSAVVLALGLAEPAGAALLLAVAAVTAWFGVTELRLARALRA
jgi:hypothetical protein